MSFHKSWIYGEKSINTHQLVDKLTHIMKTHDQSNKFKLINKYCKSMQINSWIDNTCIPGVPIRCCFFWAAPVFGRRHTFGVILLCFGVVFLCFSVVFLGCVSPLLACVMFLVEIKKRHRMEVQVYIYVYNVYIYCK